MRINKSELFAVSCPVDANLTKVQIKLNNNIKKVKVLALEAFNANVFPKSPSGQPTVTQAIFNQAILVLNSNGNENVQIPLISLKRTKAEAIAGDVSVNSPTELSGQNIDWEKSYIKFGGSVDTSALPLSDFVFLVHYQ